MLLLSVCLLIAAAFCAAWYWLAQRHNRRRALQVVRWLEIALGGQGQPTGIRWVAHAKFKVPLHLRCGVFHRAWILVDLIPCEMPFRWLLNRIRHRREVLTFQADLDLPPAFSLHVHNFRWLSKGGRKKVPSGSSWGFVHSGPIVMSTRKNWQREISSAMSSLTRDDNREFLDISFQNCSPHFSATLPLDTIAPGSPTRTCMFETMRELAASSSASLS